MAGKPCSGRTVSTRLLILDHLGVGGQLPPVVRISHRGRSNTTKVGRSTLPGEREGGANGRAVQVLAGPIVRFPTRSNVDSIAEIGASGTDPPASFRQLTVTSGSLTRSTSAGIAGGDPCREHDLVDDMDGGSRRPRARSTQSVNAAVRTAIPAYGQRLSWRPVANAYRTESASRSRRCRVASHGEGGPADSSAAWAASGGAPPWRGSHCRGSPC